MKPDGCKPRETKQTESAITITNLACFIPQMVGFLFHAILQEN
jgi:hypothetical protein